MLDKSALKYVPVAFILVIVAFAVAAKYPQAIYSIFDPDSARERHVRSEMSKIAASDTPLTHDEAMALFMEAEPYWAAVALAGQDRAHGLPPDFIAHLEALFIDSEGADPRASGLLGQLAEHRALSVNVEETYAQLAKAQIGYGQATSVLGAIGIHRALSRSTLEILLQLADDQSGGADITLHAMIRTARAGHLPDWTIPHLIEIAHTRRSTVRSRAMEVIGASGHRDQALALLNAPSTSRPDATAVAAALEGDNAVQLLAAVTNPEVAIEVRTGALDLLVKRREESETIGAALTFAFQAEPALVNAAFAQFGSYGRHHTRHIDIDWSAVCARAFDGDERTRYSASSAFHFVPFATLAERDAFVISMLRGTSNQQRTALGATLGLQRISDGLKQEVERLQGSADPQVAQLAAARVAAWTPKEVSQTIEETLLGWLFWVCLALPIVVAVGWQTWFFAKLMQRFAVAGRRRIVLTLVNIAWFAISVALGFAIFIGLLAFGHGGDIGATIFGLLVGTGLAMLALGWLANLFVRP